MAVDLTKITLGAGVIYVNDGEADEFLLGPTRGGGSFEGATEMRDIEYDNKEGPTKGAVVIDQITGVIKTTVINYAQKILSFLAPGIAPLSTVSTASVTPGTVGLIPDANYLKNVAYYVPMAGGGYKKYKLLNPLCRNGISAAHKDKGEGELALEFTGHHDKDGTGDIWEISDVAAIA
jgi:hypothetical protein